LRACVCVCVFMAKADDAVVVPWLLLKLDHKNFNKTRAFR